MEINYKNIGSDLKAILFEEFRKNEDVLFVFENSASFFEIKREFLRDEEIQQELGIFQNFKMMNSYDFYENLFITDKIVIKEEKQVVLFYNALTQKLKKKMKIKNYYDVIDIAYNYYNLFAELQEYKIDLEKVELEKWQVKTFKTLLEIDNEIKKIVQLKGLILPYMLRNVENISDSFLKKFNKICFVNKVKITPFEKEIIKNIESRGIIVKNILQLSKNDFNEEKLKINDSFSIPNKSESLEKFETNIEIFEYENKFSQLLGMIKKLNDSENEEKIENIENFKIYDLQNNGEDGKKDYQLLKQEKISSNLEITMQKTKIYKILELICNILENVKVIGKNSESDEVENEDFESRIETEKNYKIENEKTENLENYEFEKENKKECNQSLKIRMKDLYDAFKSNDFLKIFKLKKSYNFFVEIAREGYKYISKNEIFRILKNQNERYYKNWTDIDIEGIINLIDEIERIFEYQTLEEYRSYLEEIFDRSGELDKDIRDKYFEALSEMVVLEDFSFDNLWSGFFSENVISASLLKLFLKYLDKKAISLNLEKSDEQDSENIAKYSINSFSAISETQKENLILLNIQDTFPKVNVNNYLFTKIQRAKIGLPISDDEKRIEIFKFYQNILGAKNVYLSYVKNQDENIDSAGVIEEIKLKYSIKAQKNKINENDELDFIKNYFLENIEKTWKPREIGKFIPSKLEKNLDKIKSKKLSLGYYDFEKMETFEYGYYLDKMIGETEIEKIEEKLEDKLFGTIIHLIYEKIVSKNKENIEKKKLLIKSKEDEKILKKEIKDVLKDVLNSYKYKISEDYLEFYKKISFKEIVKSVEKILKKMMKRIENEDEIKIYSEEKIKLKSEKKLYENIFINGVIDLHLKLKEKEILYDYKSGVLKNKKGEEKKEKVDNAFKQLDYYSIMLSERNSQEIEKFVVDVWNGDIMDDKRKEEEEFLNEDDILKVVKKYYETDYYDIGDVKDVQNYTYQTYKNICRREDELNDENK